MHADTCVRSTHYVRNAYVSIHTYVCAYIRNAHM